MKKNLVRATVHIAVLIITVASCLLMQIDGLDAFLFVFPILIPLYALLCGSGLRSVRALAGNLAATVAVTVICFFSYGESLKAAVGRETYPALAVTVLIGACVLGVLSHAYSAEQLLLDKKSLSTYRTINAITGIVLVALCMLLPWLLPHDTAADHAPRIPAAVLSYLGLIGISWLMGRVFRRGQFSRLAGIGYLLGIFVASLVIFLAAVSSTGVWLAALVALIVTALAALLMLIGKGTEQARHPEAT